MNTKTLIHALHIEAKKLRIRHETHLIGEAFKGLADTIRKLESVAAKREERDHRKALEGSSYMGQN